MVARTSAADLKAVGLKEGFRSGLEDKVAEQLRAAGIDPQIGRASCRERV